MSEYFDQEVFRRNRENRERILKTYGERQLRDSIPDSLTAFPETPAADLKRRRRFMRQLRAYYAQTLRAMAAHGFSCHAAYTLFDMDGCMIRLNGTEETVRRLEQKGIRLGSIWDFDRMGLNAVTVGLRERCAFYTEGEENYQKQMKDLAVYFSPICLGAGEKEEPLGGVAILVPMKYAGENYQMSAAEIASYLMIRVSMALRTSASYDDVDAKGMVLLDINRRNGSVTVTHHNTNFFDILGLPRESSRNVYFKPASEYFDPRPENMEFWDIVQETKEVRDREMTLLVRGKKVDCILSAKPHREDNVDTRGTLLYITTKRQISRQISEKASNSAILTADNIIGQSTVMKSQIRKATLLAHTDSNVMILGESGSGKEVFAQAIHNMSERRDRPFIAVNCGALPKDLIESELFGYESGAFTGAKKQGNIGKFELADGGTLFLDEIGELPLDLQATLLRAVELKSFMRIGGRQTIHTDVKIISATNADIRRMIDEKKFRADLYYRLGTMQLFLPPLRERGNDVVILAEYFGKRIADRTGRGPILLTEDAKQFLRACPWRGNVRELQNLMECVVQLYPDTTVTMERLMENADPSYRQYLYGMPHPFQSVPFPQAMQPGEVRFPVPGTGTSSAFDAAAISSSGVPWNPGAVPSAAVSGRFSGQISAAPDPGPLPPRGQNIPRGSLTREELVAALERCGNNRSAAARELGIGRKTLYRYLERFHME